MAFFITHTVRVHLHKVDGAVEAARQRRHVLSKHLKHAHK
jgi:hypothetical protein